MESISILRDGDPVLEMTFIRIDGVAVDRRAEIPHLVEEEVKYTTVDLRDANVVLLGLLNASVCEFEYARELSIGPVLFVPGRRDKGGDVGDDV